MFLYFAVKKQLEKKVDLKPSIGDLIGLFKRAFLIETQAIAKVRDIRLSRQLALEKVIPALEKKLQKHLDNAEKVKAYQQKLKECQAEKTTLQEEKETFEKAIENHPLKKLIGDLEAVNQGGREELLGWICKHFYNYKGQHRDFSSQWGSRALERNIVLPSTLRSSKALRDYLRDGNPGQSTGIAFSRGGSKKFPIRDAIVKEGRSSQRATAEKFVDFMPEKPRARLLSFLQVQEALERIQHATVTCQDSNLNKSLTKLFRDVIQRYQTSTNSHIIAFWDFAQFDYRVNSLIEALRKHAPQQADFLSDRLKRARVEVVRPSDDDHNCSEAYRLYEAYHGVLVAYLQKDDLFDACAGNSTDPSNTLALYKFKEQALSCSSVLEKSLIDLTKKEDIDFSGGYLSDSASDTDETDESWRGMANWKTEMKELLVSPFCAFSPFNTNSDDSYVREAREQFEKRGCTASYPNLLFPAYEKSPAEYGFYDAREVVKTEEAHSDLLQDGDVSAGIEGAQTITVAALLQQGVGENSSALFANSGRLLDARNDTFSKNVPDTENITLD